MKPDENNTPKSTPVSLTPQEQEGITQYFREHLAQTKEIRQALYRKMHESRAKQENSKQ